MFIYISGFYLNCIARTEPISIQIHTTGRFISPGPPLSLSAPSLRSLSLKHKEDKWATKGNFTYAWFPDLQRPIGCFSQNTILGNSKSVSSFLYSFTLTHVHSLYFSHTYRPTHEFTLLIFPAFGPNSSSISFGCIPRKPPRSNGPSI